MITQSTTRRDAAAAIWRSAVVRVAAAWNARFSGREDRPWIDVELDLRLHEKARGAIQRGDVGHVKEISEQWLEAWRCVFRAARESGDRNRQETAKATKNERSLPCVQRTF
ncbi:MAG: hypothetical protein JXA57_02310 [Armatimonadetes bacterium]|nr:hypothetical protein [Armatimonadota bacterium]